MQGFDAEDKRHFQIMKTDKSKIGIITLVDYTNYGNRLQNLALTKLLEEQGYSVVNDIEVYTKSDFIDRSKGIKRTVKKVLPVSLMKKRMARHREELDDMLTERQRRFKEFASGYIDTIDPVFADNNEQALKILNEKGIDVFIAGSDQVWNPNYFYEMYTFLPFAPKDKRLSFAASFGIDSIPESRKKEFSDGLSQMKYISVREKKALEIVKELTGRDADLTPDPTLLLGRKEWEKIIIKPDIDLAENYICSYFLGEVPEAVMRFAKDKNLTLYNLNSEEDEKLFTLDPAEFLYVLTNAKYVLTDSFHAMAFSLVFHKEFYIFRRKQDGVSDMFSRIENTTDIFGLGSRIQSRDKIDEQAPVIDWDRIDEHLAEDKEKSMRRLI